MIKGRYISNTIVVLFREFRTDDVGNGGIAGGTLLLLLEAQHGASALACDAMIKLHFSLVDAVRW